MYGWASEARTSARNGACWVPAHRPTAAAVLAVEGYAGYDQRDTEDSQCRRYLDQDHGADATGGGGQQRDHERAGGAGEPGHGEPVTDLGKRKNQ
jgi:hypothetical protein